MNVVPAATCVCQYVRPATVPVSSPAGLSPARTATPSVTGLGPRSAPTPFGNMTGPAPVAACAATPGTTSVAATRSSGPNRDQHVFQVPLRVVIEASGIVRYQPVHGMVAWRTCITHINPLD